MTDMDGEVMTPINWSRLSVTPSSVSAEIAARLETMILEGQIPTGSRLPPERELERLLGVSRVSVREALHDLEMKGMIDRKPGRGTIVIASDRAAGIGSLLARLPDDERGLLEIMDFRSAIEPPIAARAAARATPRDLRTLYDLVSRMESASDDEETKALDEAFHTAVARATHNSMFVKLLTLTADWLSASRQMGLQSHRRRQASIEAHRRIVEAIAARDAHGGLVAMAEHIDSINHLLSEQLSGPARRLRGTWPAETDHEPTTPAGSG